MIGVEDAPNTYEYEGHYKILPVIHNWSTDPNRIKNGVKVPESFSYSSDSNSAWMTMEELSEWILQNREIIGVI